jgi:hypothetical protein
MGSYSSGDHFDRRCSLHLPRRGCLRCVLSEGASRHGGCREHLLSKMGDPQRRTGNLPSGINQCDHDRQRDHGLQRDHGRHAQFCR